MKNNPLVSVVIPSYNSGKFISETLKSVSSQTYEEIEIIVVDDCSTDNTIEIIKKHNDPRLVLIQLEKNKGVANARNVGIANSKGTYIAFVDSDDVWIKDKLKKQIKIMEQYHALLSYTAYEIIDETNKNIKQKCKLQ